MDELERKWIEEILWVIRRAGTHAGTLAEAERKSGVKPEYLVKAMDGGNNPPLGRVLALIRHLGLDPVEVVAEALGGHVERRHIHRPRTPVPMIVKQARERFTTTSSSMIPRSFLVTLDEERYNNPRDVMASVEGAMAYLDPADVPFALGIYASAARPVLELDTARWALFEALDMARSAQDLWTEGELLLRASYFHNEKGHYQRALETAGAATNAFARAGFLEDVGRGLVAQAIFLGQLERNLESEAAFESAIQWLDPTDSRGLFVSWQGLGIMSQRRDSPLEALERFDRAKTYATNDLQKGKLFWACGLAFADLGNWRSFADSFETAVQMLVDVAVVDAALAACDQVKILLEYGKASEAWLMSTTMVRLVSPLEAKSQVAAAAAKDLALALNAAPATTSMVAAIAAKIKDTKRQAVH